MNAYEKALLIVDALYGELELGTKHYRDGKLITSPLEILEAIRDNKLVIEPIPERQYLFKEVNHEKTKMPYMPANIN